MLDLICIVCRLDNDEASLSEAVKYTEYAHNIVAEAADFKTWYKKVQHTLPIVDGQLLNEVHFKEAPFCNNKSLHFYFVSFIVCDSIITEKCRIFSQILFSRA
jgi:hypothetical protein